MYNTYKSTNLFFCGLPISVIFLIFSINEYPKETSGGFLLFSLLGLFIFGIAHMIHAKEVKISNEELLYKDSSSSTHIRYIRSECNFELVRHSRWSTRYITYDLVITCNNETIKHGLYHMSQFKVIEIGKELGIDVPYLLF